MSKRRDLKPSQALPELLSSLSDVEHGRAGIPHRGNKKGIHAGENVSHLAKTVSAYEPILVDECNDGSDSPPLDEARILGIEKSRRDEGVQNSYEKMKYQAEQDMQLSLFGATIAIGDKELRGEYQYSKSQYLSDLDLPPHIQNFKEDYDRTEQNRIKLPLISQLSPRTRKHISSIPKFTQSQIQQSEELLKLGDDAATGRNHIEKNDLFASSRKGRRSVKKNSQLFKQLSAVISRNKNAQYYKNGRTAGEFPAPTLPTDQSRTFDKRKFDQNEFSNLETDATKLYDKVAARKERLAKQEKNRLVVTLDPSEASSLASSIDRPASPTYKKYPFKSNLTEFFGRHPSETEVENKSKDQNSHSPQKTRQNPYNEMFNEVTSAANAVSTAYEQSMQMFEKDQLEKTKYMKKSNDFLDSWKSHLIDELNVHVDPDFSRARTYGKAVNMIIYYVYLTRVKTTFKHWKRWLKETNKNRRLQAGALLVRVSRGVLARREVFELRENARKQREAEELREKERQIFRNSMCRRIQKRYRRYRKQCLFLWNKKRRMAATMIQVYVRISLAKLRVQRIIKHNILCSYSATAIQKRWRIVLAKRRLVLLGKLEKVRQWELSMEEKKLLQRVHYRHHGASLALSKVYRAHTIHKRLQTILYWNRFNLAMRIQAFYRGYLARVMCARFRANLAAKQRERDEAAAKIQSWCRRYLAQKSFKKIQEKKAHKIEKRKKRKKKKLKDVKIPISASRKINLSSWKRSMRRVLRASMPFRYLFEHKKAITIQRHYRGFHARRRVVLLRIKKKLRELYGSYERKVWAAIFVQKIYRGHLRRREMRKELWRRMAIKIQCYWRRRDARRVVFRMRQRLAAVAILNEKLSAVIIGMVIRRRVAMERKYSKNIVVIQRLIRKYIGRKQLRQIKDAARVRVDCEASAELTSMKVISACELKIIKESMERDIMAKFPAVSGQPCPCSGPVQAMFLFACGKKARYDPSQLASNKLDASSLSKFLQKVDLITDTDKNKKPRRVKPADKTALTVLKAIKMGLVKLPRIVYKLKPTDIDVLFNRHKAPGGATVLEYLEFCEMLRGCAGYNSDRGVLEPIDPEVSRFVSFKERVSRSGTASTQHERSRSNTTSRSSTGKRTLVRQGTRESLLIKSKSQKSFSDLFFQDPKSGARKHYMSVKFALDEYLFDIDNLLENRETIGIPIVLIMLLSFEYEPWVDAVFKWITAESHARIASFLVPIQCLVRKRLARVRMRRRRIQRNIERQEENTMRSIRLCQGAIRRRLQWLRIVKTAQRVLIKYIPHKGKPYWYNPRTRVSSYSKPKILGSYDCIEVPLPAPKLEYLVKCGVCENVDAQVNCDQCEESMCKSCFATMHCKGKRQLHTCTTIPPCSLCGFQMATKSCMTCSLRKPKKGSLMALVDGERGMLCDTCYVYVHDGANSTSAISTKKIGNDSQVAEDTKEAFLVQLEMNLRLDTDHRYSALVQYCEECQWRGASYRCSDCDQVYCSKCLMGFHSIGGPFSSHRAEKLPYYTPDMHKKFERAMFTQRLQHRIEKVAQQYAKAFLKRKVKSIIKLQSWWRMLYYGIPAKAVLKEGRLKERRKWRVRQLENKQYRSKLSYKIKDVFGFAPQLQSDSVEEAVLKKHSVFRRQRIRHFIYQNCDDWGFLQQAKLGLDPPVPPTRKGTPRKGFDFGTLEELRDQAKRGGYRILGRVHMVTGETEHVVDRDLTKYVRRGMLLRIGAAFFGVVKCKEGTLVLNRRWRFKSKENCLIFRLPCMKNDKYRLEYKIRMKAFDLITGNPFAQGMLKGYEGFFNFIAKKARERSIEEKKAGFVAQSKKWALIADSRESKGAWATNLIFQGGGPVDLGSVDGTAEKSNPYKSAKAKRCVAPHLRVPGEEWEATKEEQAVRDAREAKMDDEALAAEAEEWEEKLDVLRNKPYWVHKKTFEHMPRMPRAVRAARDLEKKRKAMRKEFAEQQKKLARLKKK